MTQKRELNIYNLSVNVILWNLHQKEQQLLILFAPKRISYETRLVIEPNLNTGYNLNLKTRTSLYHLEKLTNLFVVAVILIERARLKTVLRFPNMAQKMLEASSGEVSSSSIIEETREETRETCQSPQAIPDSQTPQTISPGIQSPSSVQSHHKEGPPRKKKKLSH